MLTAFEGVRDRPSSACCVCGSKVRRTRRRPSFGVAASRLAERSGMPRSLEARRTRRIFVSWALLAECCELEMRERCGKHSLRKSIWYWFWMGARRNIWNEGEETGLPRRRKAAPSLDHRLHPSSSFEEAQKGFG